MRRTSRSYSPIRMPAKETSTRRPSAIGWGRHRHQPRRVKFMPRPSWRDRIRAVMKTCMACRSSSARAAARCRRSYRPGEQVGGALPTPRGGAGKDQIAMASRSTEGAGEHRTDLRPGERRRSPRGLRDTARRVRPHATTGARPEAIPKIVQGTLHGLNSAGKADAIHQALGEVGQPMRLTPRGHGGISRILSQGPTKKAAVFARRFSCWAALVTFNDPDFFFSFIVPKFPPTRMSSSRRFVAQAERT